MSVTVMTVGRSADSESSVAAMAILRAFPSDEAL
jgi:hypothetical protein